MGRFPAHADTIQHGQQMVAHPTSFLAAAMCGQNIIRVFLFVVFFSIGAAALSSSILCDDLIQYYQNTQLLEDAQEFLNQLKALNADYDALLNQLGEDPNLFKRIGPAALGIEREEPNTVYPSATVEQLAIARKVLAQQPDTLPGSKPDDSTPENSPTSVPTWLTRCSEPRRRVMLFVTGAGLILVSFVCFCPAGKRPATGTSAAP
jgi:hypothetical protein